MNSASDRAGAQFFDVGSGLFPADPKIYGQILCFEEPNRRFFSDFFVGEVRPRVKRWFFGAPLQKMDKFVRQSVQKLGQRHIGGYNYVTGFVFCGWNEVTVQRFSVSVVPVAQFGHIFEDDADTLCAALLAQYSYESQNSGVCTPHHPSI